MHFTKIFAKDKGGSEAAMAAVNEAYEVLSNPGMFPVDLTIYTCTLMESYYLLPELRARFDRGDDPNDTSGQQAFHQQGFNPHAQQMFRQFFQQQSGGRMCSRKYATNQQRY